MIANQDATGKLPVITTDDDIAAIKKNMRAYTYYDSAAALVAAMNTIAKATENFCGLQVFAQGIERGESGDYMLTDETKYADSTPVLAYVGGQNKTAGGKSTPVIKAILAFGIPTVDVTLAQAPDLAKKVLGKEFRHVYFRGFRDADTIAAAMSGFEASPVGIEAFAASHARSAAEELDTDTFDAIWPAIRKRLTASHPALAKLLPPKGEVIKAMRSASYALGMYKDLEEKNIFLGLAVTCIEVAQSQDKPLDASTIKSWAVDRNTVNIDYKRVTAEDLESLQSYDAAAAFKALGIEPSTEPATA